VTQPQNILVLVALALIVLLYSIYYSSPASPSAPSTIPELVVAFALVAVAIAAVLLYYIRPAQRRPGETVSY
jgi:presenilin-like A22 family membrane protease